MESYLNDLFTGGGWPGMAGAAVGVVVIYLFFRRLGRLKLGRLEAVATSADALPDDVRAYFDSQDEGLRRAGFERAGDYQTVHGERPSYSRFYLAREGDTFAEVTLYRKINPTLTGMKDYRGITLTSVFADGTALFTGDMSLPDGGAAAPPQMILRGRPEMALDERLEAHRGDARAYAEERETSLLHYPPDQLADVSVYYTQYQREHFVSKRVLEPPPGFEETAQQVRAGRTEDHPVEVSA